MLNISNLLNLLNLSKSFILINFNMNKIAEIFQKYNFDMIDLIILYKKSSIFLK